MQHVSSFIEAINGQQAMCIASCSCNRNTSASARSPNEDFCTPPPDVRSYLTTVYPLAARRLSSADDAMVSAFFNSLHFYYDHGCGNKGLACNEPGGVLLRWLYAGLLPCVPSSTNPNHHHHHPSLAGCVRAHRRFAPEWERRALSQGYVEVEHRAIGFGTVRVSTQAAGLFTAKTGEPSNASAFMDSGVAAMWYTFRRGSGIFYKLGRTLAAPGKTAMVATLLRQLSEHPTLVASWPAFVKRGALFASSISSGGALADADRLESVANGSATCAEKKVQPCRCRYVLHDSWDDAMVWLARALGYDTLFITATLLCNQPIVISGSAINTSSPARGFAMAYPELVDVRPFDAATVDDQARGHHSYLATTHSSEVGDAYDQLRARRKRPELADAWIRKMRDAGLLSLRDPFDPAASPAQPCHFSVQRWTLQCAGHISTRWPQSPWNRCGIVGCGYSLRSARERGSPSSTT